MKIDWKQVVAGLAAGLILGAGMGAWQIRRLHRGFNSAAHQQRMLERFSSRLKLTEEQRAKVSAILEAKRLRIDALRAEAVPKIEELRAATRAEIRALLAAKQLPDFEKLTAELEARRKERGRP